MASCDDLVGCFSIGGGSGGDKGVTLHPYFKIHPGDEAAFAALTDTFYAQTKTEEDCKYYGFSFKQDHTKYPIETVVFCRECYDNANGLIAHLANVGGTLGNALKISDLVGLECHAPASEMWKLQAHPILKDFKCTFFTNDKKGIRKPGQYSTAVTMHPYFKIHDGKEDEFKANTARFYGPTAYETKMLSYSFGFTADGKRACINESYKNADGVVDHIEKVGEAFGKALEVADLERLEVHGPSAEIAKLKANPVLKDCKAVFFVLDGKGIQH